VLEIWLVVASVVVLAVGGFALPLLSWMAVLELGGAERRAVLRWFFLGGAGFVITLAGCAAALVGALLVD
jgi:hypothetical protein